MFDLFPAALERRKAKTIGSDHHAAVHDAPRADAAANAQFPALVRDFALAHRGARTHEALRADHRAFANLRARLHHRQRADRDADPQRRMRVDHRAGMHALCRHRSRTRGPPLREARKAQIGIGQHDGRAARRRRVPHGRRHDHAAGLRLRELRLISRIGEKGECRRRGAFERADARDAQAGVADQLAAEVRGNRAEREVRGVRHGAITWRLGRSGP